MMYVNYKAEITESTLNCAALSVCLQGACLDEHVISASPLLSKVISIQNVE